MLAITDLDEIDPGVAMVLVDLAAVLLVIDDLSNLQYWSYTETTAIISADIELHSVSMQLVKKDEADEANSRWQKHLS